MKGKVKLQGFVVISYLVSIFALIYGGMSGALIPVALGVLGFTSASILAFLMIRGTKSDARN